MKKLFGATVAVFMVFGFALHHVSATVETGDVAEEVSVYQLTTVDYAIIDKFAEKIDEIALEKGEAFKVGIVALIRTLAQHEKTTERVTAVFVELANVVENGSSTETPEVETGSTADTGTNLTGNVNTGSTVETGA